MTDEQFDPAPELALIDEATARVLASVRGMDDHDLQAPSLCSGWTRGHVVAHIARNADGLANLLHWAATGEVTPQYPSDEARDADIEAGSGRGAAEQVADLEESAARFRAAAAAVPADRWDALVTARSGELSAADVLWGRWRELEIHHLDLAAGYSPADWPEDFVRRLLAFAAAKVAAHPDAPAAALRATDLGVNAELGGGTPRLTVSGPGRDLAAWLVSRSPGTTLTCEPAGPLPPLPSYG